MKDGAYLWLLLFACGVWSAMLMYRFRHYLRPRKKGEDLSKFIERAQAERATYVEARDTLHGSRKATVTSGLITVIGCLGLLWLMTKDRDAGLIGFGYMLIGTWLAPKLVTPPPQYQQVAGLDRLNWRIGQSWLWPLYLIQKSKGTKQ